MEKVTDDTYGAFTKFHWQPGQIGRWNLLDDETGVVIARIFPPSKLTSDRRLLGSIDGTVNFHKHSNVSELMKLIEMEVIENRVAEYFEGEPE